MARARRVYYRRQWLNKPGYQSHGHVIAHIKRVPGRKGEAGEIDASFSIADCTRVADLDFWFSGSRGDENNVIHKAELFRKIVNEFVEKLLTEYEDLQREREEKASVREET